MTSTDTVATAGADEAQAHPAQSRWRRMAGPGALVGAIALGTVYVALVDPNQPGHYPLCPTKALSGLDCPGCGGLRATHDLAHGNIAGAFSHNALWVLLVPVVVLLLVRALVNAWTGRTWGTISETTGRRLMIGLSVALVLFTVVRNLPFVPLLGSA